MNVRLHVVNDNHLQQACHGYFSFFFISSMRESGMKVMLSAYLWTDTNGTSLSVLYLGKYACSANDFNWFFSQNVAPPRLFVWWFITISISGFRLIAYRNDGFTISYDRHSRMSLTAKRCLGIQDFRHKFWKYCIKNA